jgi:hypothetical protein
MTYAVTDPEGNFASGRAKLDILFGKMVLSKHHFSKRSKEYHAAAGESGFHLGKRPI